MIRRPPRSTQSRSSAASDVYKRQSMSRRPSVVSAADFLAGNRHTPMSVSTSSSSSTTFSPGSSFSAYHSNTDENAKAEADLGAEGVSGRRRLSAEGSMASGVATSGFPDDLTSASSSSSKSTSTSESGGKGTRGRRGRKSFKEWQDDSRWDLKVRPLKHEAYIQSTATAAAFMGQSVLRLSTLHRRFHM